MPEALIFVDGFGYVHLFILQMDLAVCSAGAWTLFYVAWGLVRSYLVGKSETEMTASVLNNFRTFRMPSHFSSCFTI